MRNKRDFTSVDEYISSFPQHTRRKLTQLRSLIKRASPQAEEKISYQMPAYFLNGVLVWFAAHSMHIGFYPKASAIAKFEPELSHFKHAKGTVQFPLDEPLPLELIKRIVKFRVAENARHLKQQAR